MPNRLASAYARLKGRFLSAVVFNLYGAICPNCKRSIVIGEIELQANAQLSDLRAAVLKMGWQEESVSCPRCQAVALCGPNDLIFVK